MHRSALALATRGAIATLVGIVLSGPVAVAVVSATHPQPSWSGPHTFAQHYHPMQSLPYAGGIVLVGGLMTLLASLSVLAPPSRRPLALVGLLACAVFATLIFLNYIVQAGYVPALARTYDDRDGALLAALSMANPRSLAWSVEMWGWAFLGVSTWLLAPVFGGSPLEDATRWAFVANGPVSLVGAVWTVAQPGWVLGSWGLAMFAAWNLLLVVMAATALVSLRRRALALAVGTAMV